MNIFRKPLTLILLLAFLAMPFTVSATAVHSDLINNVQSFLPNTPANIADAVSKAVQANPGQGETIAAALVSDAIKNNPDLAAADIVAAVIKANPGLAVAVTTAAVKAAPDKAVAIIIAAVSEAPKQASAIGAAALAAAQGQGQASSIVSALAVAVGGKIPNLPYSELMTNNLALQTAVTVAAIAACGGTPACTTSVLNQVKEQTSNQTYNEITYALTQQGEKPVSQNY